MANNETNKQGYSKKQIFGIIFLTLTSPVWVPILIVLLPFLAIGVGLFIYIITKKAKARDKRLKQKFDKVQQEIDELVEYSDSLENEISNNYKGYSSCHTDEERDQLSKLEHEAYVLEEKIDKLGTKQCGLQNKTNVWLGK